MSHEFTPEQLTLLPNENDVGFFRKHGWYISKKLFTDLEIERVVHGADRYYADERDHAMPVTGDWITGWRPEHGDCLRKNDFSSLQLNELAEFVRNPLISAAAALLIGTAEIRLWHDQLLYKPVDRPERKANVGWHTDRGYWKTCTSDDLLTAWAPFHDCDESMGTLTAIDGSHRWPDNGEKLNFFDHDLDALESNFVTGGNRTVKVPMVLKKGQVSFHHCKTIHGSGPNRSSRPRRSMAIHMQPGDNRWRRHLFANGKIAGHANDAFCRKNAAGDPDYTDPAVCPVLYCATTSALQQTPPLLAR